MEQRAIELNSFSVEIRYPNELIELTKEELESCIQTAELFKSLSEEYIGIV